MYETILSEIESSTEIADCVKAWVRAHASYDFQQDKNDEFYCQIAGAESGHEITSPPEQLFLCVWANITAIGVRLHPQHSIGKFKADFMANPLDHFFSQTMFHPDKLEEFANILPRYVIEIDGFEWHDKTPQQAERDKKRDRFIHGQGYQVLRFAAREVLRDPKQCVLEVEKLLVASISDLYGRLTLK